MNEHFTDYVGSLVFEDNTLNTVLFEGGYIDAQTAAATSTSRTTMETSAR